MKVSLFLSCLMIFSLFTATFCIAGNRCEVTDFKPYERPGVGYADSMYFQIVEKCAEVVIKNTGGSHWFATDIKVTAFFENGDVKKGAINGEQDRLQKVEPGKTYSTTVCFGADPAQIEKMDCDR
jgi:hypothetical protein